MKTYNGVIRVYEGEPGDDEVTHEVGFTFKTHEEATAFVNRAFETLEKLGANPDYVTWNNN